jgi:acetoin utilization protein AcuB
MKHCAIDPQQIGSITESRVPIEVRDYMSSPAITIDWEAPLATAITMMRARNIRHLPVVDAEARLLGILTDGDVREALIALEHTGARTDFPSSLIVGKVMTWGAEAVTPDTDIAIAARLMHDRKLSALPVVEGERVVGILTEVDALRGFIAILDATHSEENPRCGF